MEELTRFLAQHAGALVFVVVFAEQAGLPIPAVPVLLAAGALAGAGRLSLPLAIALAVVACVLGDLIWYYLGRHRGARVLRVLCRISLEPDSCVRRTENFFLKHGVKSLVIAKFIPGLNTVTPALAGLFNISLERFLLYNGLGAIVWTLAFVLPGYALSHQLENLSGHIARFQGSLLAVSLGGLALYIAYKFLHRYRVLRELRIARIMPEELKAMLEKGGNVVVVDLRQALEVERDPYTIPGAMLLSVEELERRHQEIPRDRDVVLFCSCPNEATAARMALMLKRNGITRVRPLAGGVEAWRLGNHPLQAVRPAGELVAAAGPLIEQGGVK